jgi:hypothetical protein
VGVYPASHIRLLIAAVPVPVLVGLFAWTNVRSATERWSHLVGLAAMVLLPCSQSSATSSSAGGDYFIYRNLIVATVRLTLVAAAVIGAQRSGRLGAVVVVVACILLSAVSVEIAQRPDLQKPDVRGVAEALGPPRTERAVVVDARTATPLSLYLDHAVVAAEGNVSIGELDLILEPGSSIVRSPPRLPSARGPSTFTIIRSRATESAGEAVDGGGARDERRRHGPARTAAAVTSILARSELRRVVHVGWLEPAVACVQRRDERRTEQKRLTKSFLA